MKTLDTYYLAYVRNNSQSVNEAFMILVKTIFKEGNTDYINHLIQTTKTKDLLGLANYIKSN